MICSECNEFLPLERNGMCASCSHAARKAEKLMKRAKVVKPLNKVSQKRAGEMAEYIKLRKQYLELYPVCEVDDCHLKAVEIHHQRGKENEKLLDTAFFMAICRKHHAEFTQHSNQAIKDGYSVKRTI